MVEILNENDNFPEFTEDTPHSVDLSEVFFTLFGETDVCLLAQTTRVLK